MSNARQETIADIVREMRQAEATWHRSEIAQLPTQYLKEWSDRIEAAAKREREATREKSSQVGNAAAHKREVAELRECLKEAIREKCPFARMSCKHGEPCDYECGTVKWRNALRNEGGAK